MADERDDCSMLPGTPMRMYEGVPVKPTIETG
jgi:hypothetical protein